MDTWPKTREQLSLTVSVAQALFLQLVKKDYQGKTISQLERGTRQPSIPFFVYQHTHISRPSTMTDDPETGNLLPVETIAQKARETVRDLGFRMRVAQLTQSRFASMPLYDVIEFEFPVIELLEAMCGPGFRIHSEVSGTAVHTGYTTFNICLVIEYNTEWKTDTHTRIKKVWPDAREIRVDADGTIHWPPTMGAPVLLPSPVDIWRKKVDALWPTDREIIAAFH